MSVTDWIILAATLLGIVVFGIWKSRGNRDIDGYFLGNQSLPWYHVCLSVMATQASAITFLSAPGLAYSTGMSFVQFYFGLPLAMIVLCITFVPIFHRLKVYTAYEFLEKRFDLKTRALTALLFLIQRGVSTGITIYAPSIILSTILNIDTTYTTLFIGGLVIVYTVYGGTRAVSYTQLLQMSIIFSGLFMAGAMVVYLLPENVGMGDALHIAGKMGRTNAIDFSFDWDNQYTVWSGLIGGFFLQLSYFGTDQSQVPMQFLILMIGVLVFAFYQFRQPPVFFNSYELNKLENSRYAPELDRIKADYAAAFREKRDLVNGLNTAMEQDDEQAVARQRRALKAADEKMKSVRGEAIGLMKKNDPGADTNDNNYIFLSFVTRYLPQGLIGLLIAIVFLASMGSTASALNSLTSTTVVDIYKRLIRKEDSDASYLLVSRITTVCWGVFCIIMALYASRLGNLIEAVNILGSLFYGTILGIFIVAFYFRKTGGSATFKAAVISEVIVCLVYWHDSIAFLWLNVIGCTLVVFISMILQRLEGTKKPAPAEQVLRA